MIVGCVSLMDMIKEMQVWNVQFPVMKYVEFTRDAFVTDCIQLMDWCEENPATFDHFVSISEVER